MTLVEALANVEVTHICSTPLSERGKSSYIGFSIVVADVADSCSDWER